MMGLSEVHMGVHVVRSCRQGIAEAVASTSDEGILAAINPLAVSAGSADDSRDAPYGSDLQLLAAAAADPRRPNHLDVMRKRWELEDAASLGVFVMFDSPLGDS